MRSTIKLYGPLIAALGCDELEYEHKQAQVGELLAALQQDYPALNDWQNRIACAINDQIARADTAIHAGDRIDLIPPVSGG